MGCVYKARNIVNGKCYVGKTKSDDEPELNINEIRLIAELNTRSPNGYNLTDGGEGAVGVVRSDEFREKLRVANTGKRHSEATKRKLSEIVRQNSPSDKMRAMRKLSTGFKGRHHTEEAKNKVREHKLGKKLPPFSAERRARMSASAKKRAASPSGLQQLAAAVELSRHVPRITSPENRAKQSAFMTQLWKCRKEESHLPVAS